MMSDPVYRREAFADWYAPFPTMEMRSEALPERPVTLAAPLEARRP